MSNTVKYKIYDSVFLDLFSIASYRLELYKVLLGDKAKKGVTEEDVEILNIDKVFTNDLYNDLGFIVDNELIGLVEAQSTYTKNIAIRLLSYTARSLEKYINDDKKRLNVYNDNRVKIPCIKLYTIYTGEKQIENHYINLKELMEDVGVESDVDLRIKVIQTEAKDNVLGQYINFTKVFRNELKKYSKYKNTQEYESLKLKAIGDTIKICKNNNILKEYLAKRETEVINMLAHNVTSEEWLEHEYEKGKEEGIAIGKERGKIEGKEEGKLEGMVLAYIKMGLDDESIQKNVNLSLEEITRIREERKMM